MNISRIAQGIAVASMIALVAAAPSVAGQEHKGKDRAEMVERAIERLELTAEQKARIAAIRDQFKAQNESLKSELKAAHEQMRDARRDGDKAEAEQIREQMKPKMEQMRAARQAMKDQILAVLTPEQRSELEKMKAEVKEKRGKKGKGEAGGRGKVKAQKERGNSKLD
jgi:protein CpxP